MYMVVFFMEEILLHHYILTKLENREVIFVTKTSLVAQTVKHLPKMREIRIQSLGQKDPLEKEMATHSSTLAWKIPRTEEPGGLQTMGSQRVGHDWVTSFSLFSLSLLLKDTEIQSKSSDVFLVCIFMKFSVAFKILQPHCFFFLLLFHSIMNFGLLIMWGYLTNWTIFPVPVQWLLNLPWLVFWLSFLNSSCLPTSSIALCYFYSNTQKRCPFHYRWLECKSRKSINTWSNRQI